MSDTLLAPLMDELRVAVGDELADTVSGEPGCALFLAPGTLAPADYCTCKGARAGRGPAKCGMAWVRLDRLFPSSQSFPAPDTTTKGCAKVLAAVLEVGVYRCVPVSETNGEPPTEAQQTNATLAQADDALALFRAITCCDRLVALPHVVGVYTPRDGGGCSGGVWTVTVQLRRQR